jgi:hypothetical protein
MLHFRRCFAAHPSVRCATTAASVSLEHNFGVNSFSRSEQAKYIDEKVLDRIDAATGSGTPVAPADADAFARGLKVWGMKRGAR